MSLPKIKLPLYHVTVPSTGQKTTFRPFTVREEKIMLTAQESKDIDQITLAVKQIIDLCVTDVDSDKLAIFDVDYILMQIRAKSVSNLLEFTIKDPDTDDLVEVEIDVSDIVLHTTDGHTKNIGAGEDCTIVMRYPTINELNLLVESGKTSQAAFSFMISCVDVVVFGDEVHKLVDYSDEEIVEFFDGVEGNTLKELENFFDTMPILRLEHKYTNASGEEKTFVIQGLETFFL